MSGLADHYCPRNISIERSRELPFCEQLRIPAELNSIFIPAGQIRWVLCRRADLERPVGATFGTLSIPEMQSGPPAVAEARSRSFREVDGRKVGCCK